MAVSEKINLDRLSYVIYEHPDRAKFLAFATDFGFERADASSQNDEADEVFLRGYGVDPYIYVARQAPDGGPKKFHGCGFRARSEADFERACRVEGAEIRDVSKRPGGGRLVSIPDVNGFEMQIVYGQEKRSVPDKGISNVFDGKPNVNGALEKPRKGMVPCCPLCMKPVPAWKTEKSD